MLKVFSACIENKSDARDGDSKFGLWQIILKARNNSNSL